jgi:(2S)-methylsuccinyl-CoA dehydrogenase
VEIVLSNVKDPKENLVGGIQSQGFPQPADLLNINRVLSESRGVGAAQSTLDQGVAYAKKRQALRRD